MNLFKKILLIISCSAIFVLGSDLNAAMRCNVRFDSGLSSATVRIGQALVEGRMHLVQAIEGLQKIVSGVNQKQDSARIKSGNPNFTYHEWFKYDAWLNCMKNARDLMLNDQTVSFASELGSYVSTYGPVLGLGMVLGIVTSYAPELIKKAYERCKNSGKSKPSTSLTQNLQIAAGLQ